MLLGLLNMHHPSQRRKALQARFPIWTPRTISQSLDAMAVEFGQRAMVVTDAASYSYADVQDWSRNLAAGLVADGVAPGDHVALIMANFPEYVAVKYAISRVGAVAVPINFLLHRQELSYILAQSECTALVVMDQLRDRDYLADLDLIAPGWESRNFGSSLPKLRRIYVFPTTGTTRAAASRLDKVAELATPEARDQLARRELTADPHFQSDVIYTSGTTGLPKGVILTHDMVLRTAYASAYTRAFEDGRRLLFALPIYHVFGYVEYLLAMHFVGGAIIPQVQFDAEQILLAAERHRASEIGVVPTMTLKLLEVARTRGFDGSDRLAVFSSGGPSPLAIWQDIRDILGAREVMTGYGMSETTASTTCTLPEGPDLLLQTTNGSFKQAGIAGDPALGGTLAQYKCVDPVTMSEVATGAPGELMARGPIITPGYYKKPEETEAAFDGEGWLHTGDIGTIDTNGNLTLAGRIKESYRCGGEMVMPKQIEDLLNAHPAVAQALVVGIPDFKMGEVGCVCVVPKSGHQRPDPDELIALCASQLARFKVPRHVLFLTVDEIPLTATGRPQKFKLRDWAVAALSP